MKNFFNRREEEIEEFMEDDDLNVIDLDETAGWSKLEVAEELAKRQAENLMEEIGDELAIIDVVEDDVEIEKLEETAELDTREINKRAKETVQVRKAAKVVAKGNLTVVDLDELEEEEVHLKTEKEVEEDDIEYITEEEDDLEYMTEDEDEEEDEEEYEEYAPFAFFENIAQWFAQWTVLDKVVAATGVLVLVVAILTVGVYAGKRGVDKQVAAFAPVGEQLETVGVVGTDKLLAVADAKKAMLEAAQLEAELNQQYDENDLSTEVKVIMKMTSVQKDLKIKFVNKKTGKLVGNVPFEVEITDSENKTYSKIDEDKDGIIYLKDIVHGNYQVAMVEIDGLEGYSFSTAKEKIKVKENIAYEKIDVTEEIKDQSEVDVSKEDTAQKLETEATLTDTVEWVESTKKESSSGEKYTQVSRDTIADPSYSASLNLDLGILRIMQQTMAVVDVSPNTYTADGIMLLNEGAVPATSITLNPTSIELQIGGTTTATITPSVQPSNTTDQVVWSVLPEGVVTVNGGSISAVAQGSATITATAGNVSATCSVTVKPAATPEPTTPKVTEVTINPSSTTIKVNESVTITASVTADEGADKTVSWASSDSNIASVDASGKVTAKAVGNATITAKAGDKTAICEVTVKAAEPTTVAVTEVALNKTTLELTVDGTETLTATVKPDNATNKTVTWSTSDSTVATVADGKVTAIKEGTATITATAGDKSATCKVTVKAKGPVATESITVTPATVTVEIGKTTVLGVTFNPENVTDKTVAWTSSDTNKATVDSKGAVTAKAEGTVTITATTSNGKTATCTVTIPKGYDPKTDTTKLLKDKSGNQMYKLVNGQYVEAKVADYYNSSITFYKKETVAQYTYTGWQNIDGKTYFFDKNGNKVTGEQVIQGARYNFNSDGTLNTGSGILGIDVSTWNGNIDWNKVKNSGVSYVIIRTGFRGSTQGSLVEDNKFRQNIQGATNAGLKVGVYFFSQAVNEVEAVEEASMVLSQVKGYKLSYPVFIDVEPSGGRGDKLSSGDRTKVINAFCQTIQNGGLRAGIYANKTWLSQKMNVSALSGYKIWLAQYNSTVTYGGRYDMWQYSDKGSVAGISGKVDMNLSYLSY